MCLRLRLVQRFITAPALCFRNNAICLCLEPRCLVLTSRSECMFYQRSERVATRSKLDQLFGEGFRCGVLTCPQQRFEVDRTLVLDRKFDRMAQDRLFLLVLRSKPLERVNVVPDRG